MHRFVAYVSTEGGMDVFEIIDETDTNGLGAIYNQEKFEEYIRASKVGSVHLTGNAHVVCLPADQASISLHD